MINIKILSKSVDMSRFPFAFRFYSTKSASASMYEIHKYNESLRVTLQRNTMRSRLKP